MRQGETRDRAQGLARARKREINSAIMGIRKSHILRERPRTY